MSDPVKYRPILFSGEMVRALLAGTKTQTRRVVKWRSASPADVSATRPPDEASMRVCSDSCAVAWGVWRETNGTSMTGTPCPYGAPGDVLWVREGWRTLDIFDRAWPSRLPEDAPIWFDADGPAPDGGGRQRSGRFIPKWAARLFLRVTAVRVERLHEISEADAIAEGVPRNWVDGLPGWTASGAGWLTPAGLANADRGEDCNEDGTVDGEPAYVFSAREAYAALWDSINGAESWDANPWVWVVTFERVERPEGWPHAG